MKFIDWSLLILGALSLFLFLVVFLLIFGALSLLLLIQLFFISVIYQLIKKYPLVALFLLIVLFGIGIAETFTIAGVTVGIATSMKPAILVLLTNTEPAILMSIHNIAGVIVGITTSMTSAILILTNYRRFRKAIKQK